jgi:hypothetical protein
VLRFLRLSPSRFQAWRRRQTACTLADQSSCPRTSPHRLRPSGSTPSRLARAVPHGLPSARPIICRRSFSPQRTGFGLQGIMSKTWVFAVTPSRGPWERDRAETRDRSAASASSVATASTTSHYLDPLGEELYLVVNPPRAVAPPAAPAGTANVRAVTATCGWRIRKPSRNRSEADRLRSPTQGPRQVPRLLRHPQPGRIRRTTGEMHAAATNLNEEQHIQALQPNRVHRHKVDRQQALSMRPNELTPRHALASAGRSESGGSQPCTDRCW